MNCRPDRRSVSVSRCVRATTSRMRCRRRMRRKNLVLEASNAGEGGIDDWSCQLLETAASLVTLLFEAERAARWQIGPGSSSDGAGPLVGSSLVMQGLRERVERVATTDFTALVEGESGTGKELVARQIHLLSRRRQGPFVAINCAALVETLIEAELFGIEERTATGVRGRRGKFEYADNGTLFLDEVSELSMAAQAKLLRTIQDLTVERVGGNGSQAGQHANRGGDQPSAGSAGRSRVVPGGSVLPLEWGGGPGAGVAAAEGGHPRARALLSVASRRSTRASPSRRPRPTRSSPIRGQGMCVSSSG